jgi:hypothetical protein
VKFRKHRRAPARRQPTQDPVPEAASGVEKLQQTAGNRAVTGLIQRQRSGRYRLLEGGLTLDPELEAMMRRLGKPEPDLFDPDVLEGVEERGRRPEWTPLPEHAPKAPEPIVPRGQGPAEPRPGKLGDIWDAVKKVPLVGKSLDKLEEEAKRRWRKARGK